MPAGRVVSFMGIAVFSLSNTAGTPIRLTLVFSWLMLQAFSQIQAFDWELVFRMFLMS